MISNTELTCNYLRMGRGKLSEVYPSLHSKFVDLKNTSVSLHLPNGDLLAVLDVALSGPQATLNFPGKKR